MIIGSSSILNEVGMKDRQNGKHARLRQVRKQKMLIGICIALLVLLSAVIVYSASKGNQNDQKKGAGVKADSEQQGGVNASSSQVSENGKESLSASAIVSSSSQGETGESDAKGALAAKVSGTLLLSAAGDCTLGVDSRYSTAFQTYYQNKGAAYFLANAKEIFSKDDITLVNFEGTLTEATIRADKKFTFKAPASYAKILTGGAVDAVTLANNHTMDFGTQGFEDTKAALNAVSIPYCYYDDIVYLERNGIKAAFLGFSQLKGVTKEQVKQGVDKAKAEGAHIIVVSFHWGIEKQYTPTEKQTEFGRYAIDCGATLVLGHHPHVVQGIETYKGRQIVYSLGNFCFGGNSNPSDKDTMVFQQTFKVEDGIVADQNAAKVIPFSLSSVKTTNDFRPTRLEGSEKQRVMEKIGKLGIGTTLDAEGNVQSTESGAQPAA